jgi:serine/threonine protein kinase
MRSADGTIDVQMNMDCDGATNKSDLDLRLVRAVRETFQSLKDLYAQPLPNPSTSYEYTLPSPPPEPGEAHEDAGSRKKAKLAVECWLPYPRSYERLGPREEVSFAFEDRLLQDRLLFTAVENEAGKRILIKFIAGCYGKEMHELLADTNGNDNSFAPLLYGCQNLSGGWKMVAMEYLPSKDWVTFASKPAGQFKTHIVNIQAALDRLWTRGWVHGDVRHHNILVSSSDKIEVRFIDFDFSERVDVDRYPLNWNRLFRPPGAEGNALMKKGHNRIMFENLFTSRADESGAGIALSSSNKSLLCIILSINISLNTNPLRNNRLAHS